MKVGVSMHFANTEPDATDQTSGVAAQAASRCVTCGTIRSGPYCGACGQREFSGRHTLRSMMRGVLGQIVNVEQGFAHTAYQLTVRPGRMVRDYLTGRTIRFTHPAGYLLLSVGAFTVISRLLGGATGAAEGDRVFAFLVIPFVAAASRVLFWRARYNYAEHLIVVMYLFAHVVMVLAVLYVAVPFLGESAGRTYATVALTLGVAYFVWGYSRVFAERALLAAVGGTIALVVGAVSWLIALSVLLTWLRT